MRHSSYQNHVVCVTLSLVLTLLAACGDPATAPTAPPAVRTPDDAAVSPTSGRGSVTETSGDASSPGTETAGSYELIARWGEPVPLIIPIGVAVLPDGSVAVADIEGSRIAMFGPNGEPESAWVADGIWNLSSGPEGQLYALASRGGSLVLVYDRDGTLQRQFEIPFATPDSRANITGVTVSSDGSIFVASGLEAGTGMDPAPFSGVLMLGPTGGEQARWAAPEGVQPQHLAVSDEGIATVVLTPAPSAQTSPSPGRFPATIVRFDAEAGPPADWLEAEVSLSREIEIDALTTLPDGLLLAVDAAGINRDDPATTVLYTINPDNGAVDELVTLDDRRGASPIAAGLAVSEAGEILLTDAMRHRVLRLSPSGEVIGELGGVRPAQLASPQGAELGPDGKLYVYDPATARVIIFDDDGGHVATWDIPRNHPFAHGGRSDIAVGDDGPVVVTDTAPGTVIVLSPEGEVADEWTSPMNISAPGGEPQIFDPDRIALFDGELHASFFQENAIASYSLDGELLDTWPEAFRQALDLVATDDGVYALVLVHGDGATPSASGAGERIIQVHRLIADGTVDVVMSIPLEYVQDDTPAFFPTHFAVAPDGSFYLADPFNRTITKLDAEGNEVASWDLPTDAHPRRGWWLALAVDDTRLYVTDSASRQVLVYEATE